jgi:hypothetical protein
MSLRADFVDPRHLSPMLGMTVRLAQRMGMHNEASYIKLPPLEAEMRRRLWWAIVIFDQRIGELSDFKASVLDPTWNCNTPLNVNDFDLRQEMKDPPTEQDRPAEALFAVVRSETFDAIRHSTFHLDFTNPALKAIAKPPEGGLDGVVKRLEERYLRFCNLDNPLHFMTVWMTRGLVAKTRLLDHYSKHSTELTKQSDEDRDEAMTYSIDILTSDTKLAESPLTEGFQWLVHYYFPLPAYMNIARDLEKRPAAAISDRAWQAMSENYRARFSDIGREGPIFVAFAKLLLYAWKARDAAFRGQGVFLPPSEMIISIRQRVASFMNEDSGLSGAKEEQASGSAPLDVLPDLPSMDFDLDALDWTAIDWNPMPGLAP